MDFIQVKNIHKSFASLEVLKGVNLSIQKGEMVSIIGRSGAGKTTLLQIIGTLLSPTQGEVIIDGTNICTLNENALAQFRNQSIGFIFQSYQLLPDFTALENVMMPALIAHQNHITAQSRAQDLLTQLGLQDRLHHLPSELSGGEKQRVAVARALMMQPKLILADEPSGSLDEQNKKDLHLLLQQLHQQYALTIIIVTHDKELASICDRTLEIKDGKI